MFRPWVTVLAVAVLACSGGSSGSSSATATPVAAANNAMLLASRGEKVAFAKTLGVGPCAKCTADVQFEILGEWIHSRVFSGLGLDGATFDGWDAPRLEASTSTTATVITVLRFSGAAAPHAERPIPLEIDLVHDGGTWRIADARMTPLPAWYKALHEVDRIDPAEPVTYEVPLTLAQVASSYRPPPPNWKR